MTTNGRRWRRALAAGVFSAALLLPTGPAVADDGCGGGCDGGCEDGGGGGGGAPSTPGLRVQVNDSAKTAPKVTGTARVDAAGNPTANLVLWDGDWGRIRDFEAHRVALLGDHDGEDGHDGGCDSGGGCGDAEDGHDSDGVRATIRGAGWTADGTRVQVWIDVIDNGPKVADEARIRIRERPGHATEFTIAGDECEGGGSGGGQGWTYRWMEVNKVQVRPAVR